MRSDLPKVLHPLAQRPLLAHVIQTAQEIHAADIHVVYGHGGEQVRQQLAHLGVDWVEQAEQLGTGHAVEQAMPHIPQENTVLVLYGDVPLLQSGTLQRLLHTPADDLSLLTVVLENPDGYGRIVRSAQGAVECIVEHKDATQQQRAICEVNTGILATSAARLHGWLQQLDNRNVQGEYYLTDIIAMAVAEGVAVHTVSPENEMEVMGVNDKHQLSMLEREYQRRQAAELMRLGVTLLDPARFDVRGKVEAGRDVTIDVNVILEGEVTLGDRVQIGANCVIRNTRIGNDVIIQPNCVIEDALIGEQSRIGPFARIRPETELAAQVHIGNFVEVKKSSVAQGSKINHLSYIGDTTVGSGVNIGAGTITCNYDGANKHRTMIGDNAFIGSDTQLVAPVTVGKGATIGAGSTITRDTPENELTLSRSSQKTISGWKRPTKK